MQGLIAAALAPAACDEGTADQMLPLSSANLALHTSRNPPAPRRSVQSFLASVAPVHAASAYDLGPPPQGELDHVKTPPRAVEAKRKRRLQDLEDRGESWVTASAERASGTANATEQALVMMAAPDAQPRAARRSRPVDDAPPGRKRTLVASMMRKRSTPPAKGADRPQSPSGGRALASDESSILVPRAGTKPGVARHPHGEGGIDEQKGVQKDRIGKENRPTKSSTSRKKNAALRDHRDMDREEEELEDLQARESAFNIGFISGVLMA